MRATKGSGGMWASRPISNGTDQSDRSIIMSRLTRSVIPHRHGLSIRKNKFVLGFFYIFFINGSTVLDITLVILRIIEKYQSKTTTKARKWNRKKAKIGNVWQLSNSETLSDLLKRTLEFLTKPNKTRRRGVILFLLRYAINILREFAGRILIYSPVLVTQQHCLEV